MAFMTAMNIVGSGLTAEQLRLDVISENVTNMNTTRTEAGGPYRRKMVVFQAESGRDGFRQAMAAAAAASNRGYENAGGVRVDKMWKLWRILAICQLHMTPATRTPMSRAMWKCPI